MATEQLGRDETVSVQPEYDRWGRMKYHPHFHAKQYQPWTTGDEKYLIEHYENEGPEAVSLALERTIRTVMQRATELRQKGLMEKPRKKVTYKRSFKER